MRKMALSTVLSLTVLAWACGAREDGTPLPTRACADVALDKASLECEPLYEPSYDNVFAITLKPTCAKSGVSCHASTGHQGGLAFENADEAYRQLLESTQVVRAGDAACSALVGRIRATDGKVRMPPGRSLVRSEQCAVLRWIQNGAKR